MTIAGCWCLIDFANDETNRTESGKIPMKITRRFTKAGQDPFATVEYEKRTSRITNPDGCVVFEMNDAEIPVTWSQLATDIMVSKYFRKAGVPQTGADGKPLLDDDGKPVTGPEKFAKQVVHRLAGLLALVGREAWLLRHRPRMLRHSTTSSAYMLIHQMCAPNSPQWFNTGLNFAYGITGPAQGHFYCDPQTGELTQATDAYTHPQPHACFIQSVADDLVNPGGIMDLWTREARLFKYGSGTGTNFSKLRGEDEKLSGGGQSQRPDELPEDRRSRGRRNQVGRHHPPRRQDGLPRSRSPGDRGLRQLEGARRAEGRRAGRGLQALCPRISRRLPRSSASSSITTSTARPTTPSPARTPTTPCASPTASSRPSRKMATGS